MDELAKAAAGANLKDFDRADLYDVRRVMGSAGDIDIATPVTEGGVRDASRPIRFFSSITVAFRGMPQLVRFEVKAGSLSECLDKWRETALVEAEKFTERAEEQYRRHALTGGLEHARLPTVRTH